MSRLPWKNTDSDVPDNQTPVHEQEVYLSDNSEGEMKQKNIKAAKEEELQKLLDFHPYEEVPDTGQSTVSTRRVITEKEGKVKARLVARGFKEEHMIQQDSLTASKEAIGILLTIAAHKQWTIKTTDIKSAFLYGKELSRDVCLRPPNESGVSERILWKLRHCLYGLKDGARQFNLGVQEKLVKLGCKQSYLDPTVFVLQTHGLNGIICCHVDDFLHAGNKALDKIMKHLRDKDFW